jgi:GrpB-like predicted nucleotidyltransferase (UPF0157 family)
MVLSVMQRSRTPHARIAVVPYDPRWPQEFERAAGEVIPALGPGLLAVHHIGSTSIPGMYAKPVIDILVIVEDLHAVDGRTAEMQTLGYQVLGEFGMEGRRYFRRDDSTGKRTHQIHAFAQGSPHVARHLAFRDFMRAHPDVAREYGDLKRRLAEAHPHDIEAYMDGKDGFIKEMEARALEWSATSAGGRPHTGITDSGDRIVD